MATSDIEFRSGSESSVARKIGRIGWNAIKLPLQALLVLVAPVVRFALTGVGVIGILVAFLFEFSGAAPRFPFWLVFGMSVGCGGLVLALNALMRRLDR